MPRFKPFLTEDGVDTHVDEMVKVGDIQVVVAMQAAFAMAGLNSAVIDPGLDCSGGRKYGPTEVQQAQKVLRAYRLKVGDEKYQEQVKLWRSLSLNMGVW